MIETENPQIQKEEIGLDLQKEESKRQLHEKLTPFFGEEGADQFVFVLEALAVDDDRNDFINHCSEAVKQLGRLLAERFGGDDGEDTSFFDLVPGSSYVELKGKHLMEKFGYRGDYHSIGAIELPPSLNAPKGISVAVDFTYSTVHTMARTPRIVFLIPGDLQALEQGITGHYGGSWKVEFRFKPKTGTYQYIGS